MPANLPLAVTPAALVDYYSRRAPEYEAMWHRDDPARQAEQDEIAAAMQALFAGRRVLEVACGTAYWTARIAEVVERIVAVDASPEMLAQARAKGWPEARVAFQEGDAFALDRLVGEFDAGCANFWLSHVPRAGVPEFLAGFHRRLGAGAAVFMADNVNVPGVGGELVAPPGREDTFKRRQLADGSEHLVLKNYFSEEELRRLLAPSAVGLRVKMGQCFWWVSYVVGRGP